MNGNESIIYVPDTNSSETMSIKENLMKLERHLKPEWSEVNKLKIENDINNIIDKQTSRKLKVKSRLKAAFVVQSVLRENNKCKDAMKFILEPIKIYIDELRLNEGLKKSKNW